MEVWHVRVLEGPVVRLDAIAEVAVVARRGGYPPRAFGSRVSEGAVRFGHRGRQPLWPSQAVEPRITHAGRGLSRVTQCANAFDDPTGPRNVAFAAVCFRTGGARPGGRLMNFLRRAMFYLAEQRLALRHVRSA